MTFSGSFRTILVRLQYMYLLNYEALQMYKACHSDKSLTIYIVMYANSNEEERYLCSLRKEQIAFEDMVREQGVCLVMIHFEIRSV